MQLTDKEFSWIVSYVHKRYGINLSQKRVLIAGRLENQMATRITVNILPKLNRTQMVKKPLT